MKFLVFIITIFVGIIMYPAVAGYLESLYQIAEAAEGATELELALFGSISLALFIAMFIIPLIDLARKGRNRNE